MWPIGKYSLVPGTSNVHDICLAYAWVANGGKLSGKAGKQSETRRSKTSKRSRSSR